MNSQCIAEAHEKFGGCYKCCDSCNYDTHRCHFCGESLHHNSYDCRGNRHWLSDCRPDLVQHEPGTLCTWQRIEDENGKVWQEAGCYAYQDHRTNEWTDEHKHFYSDGPMG